MRATRLGALKALALGSMVWRPKGWGHHPSCCIAIDRAYYVAGMTMHGANALSWTEPMGLRHSEGCEDKGKLVWRHFEDEFETTVSILPLMLSESIL
eukprot:scaffold45143_cov19-Prasinocladus_malaysianus.AAC.1